MVPLLNDQCTADLQWMVAGKDASIKEKDVSILSFESNVGIIFCKS